MASTDTEATKEPSLGSELHPTSRNAPHAGPATVDNPIDSSAASPTDTTPTHPLTFGVTLTDDCGHCLAPSWCAALSEWGRFCLACCRWCVYVGPAQSWGSGMGSDNAYPWMVAA